MPRTARTTLRVPCTLTASAVSGSRLGPVHVRVGGGVQDDVGGEGVDGRAHGGRVTDVERRLAAEKDVALEDAAKAVASWPPAPVTNQRGMQRRRPRLPQLTPQS